MLVEQKYSTFKQSVMDALAQFESILNDPDITEQEKETKFGELTGAA